MCVAAVGKARDWHQGSVGGMWCGDWMVTVLQQRHKGIYYLVHQKKAAKCAVREVPAQ